MDDGPQTYFKIPLAKRRTEVLAQEAKDSSRARESGNVGGATSRSFLRDNNTRSAFERQRRCVKEYLHYYEGGRSAKELPEWRENIGPTEVEILKENHRFLREDDEREEELAWEERVARKYYDELYKEYCIADLSKYKEGSVALRWRTREEVMSGRGQFVCGNLKCERTSSLKSWEVNFGYVEDNVKKSALVKVRLCRRCSYKLNYKRFKMEPKQIELPSQDS